MRLLVITAFYPPHHLGGFEMRCRDVVEGLRARGHETTIITNRCETADCRAHRDEMSTHRVLGLKSAGTTIWGQIWRDRQDTMFIDRKAREFAPDIVYLWHIQNLSNAILPYFAGKAWPIVLDEGGSGLIYLARMHRRGLYFYKNDADPLLKKRLKTVINAFARAVSSGRIEPDWNWPDRMHIYFNSKSALRHARENGVPVGEARVIHSGIDIGAFPYAERDGLHSPLVVLVPGRIKPEKGTRDAVSLLNELNRRGVRARLELVGPVQSQGYFDGIMAAAREAGLDGLVEYHTIVAQAELSRRYRESEFCFFPSYFKTGFSRVPLEAMASGSVVLTYGNEGSSECIRDGETGFVVAEGDVAGAASLIQVLLGNPVRAAAVVRRARVVAEQEYTFGRYLDLLEAYLSEGSLAGYARG